MSQEPRELYHEDIVWIPKSKLDLTQRKFERAMEALEEIDNDPELQNGISLEALKDIQAMSEGGE